MNTLEKAIAENRPISVEEFLRVADQLHDGRYTYDLGLNTEFLPSEDQKITLICKEHGRSEINALSHLRNSTRVCPQCLLERRRILREPLDHSSRNLGAPFDSKNFEIYKPNLASGVFSSSVYIDPILQLASALVVLSVSSDSWGGTTLERVMVSRDFTEKYWKTYSMIESLERAWSSEEFCEDLNTKIGELLDAMAHLEDGTNLLRYVRFAMNQLYEYVFSFQEFEGTPRDLAKKEEVDSPFSNPSYELASLLKFMLEESMGGHGDTLFMIDQTLDQQIRQQQNTGRHILSYLTDDLLSDVLVDQNKLPDPASNDIEAERDFSRLDLCFGYANALSRALNRRDFGPNTFGLEINEKPFLYGLARLLLLENNPEKIHLRLEDALNSDCFNQQFEQILLDPPGGSRGSGVTNESAFLIKALDLLAPGGVATVVLSEGFLKSTFRPDREARKRLLEDFTFEVITFPFSRHARFNSNQRAIIVRVINIGPSETYHVKELLSDTRGSRGVFGKGLRGRKERRDLVPKFDYDIHVFPVDFAKTSGFKIRTEWEAFVNLQRFLNHLAKFDTKVVSVPLSEIASVESGYSWRSSDFYTIDSDEFSSDSRFSDGAVQACPVLHFQDLVDGISEPRRFLVEKKSIKNGKKNSSVRSLDEIVEQHSLRLGDLVLPSNSRNTKVQRVNERFVGWLPSKSVVVIRHNESSNFHFEFLFRLLSTQAYIDFIASEVRGSVIPFLPLADLRELQIPVISSVKQEFFSDGAKALEILEDYTLTFDVDENLDLLGGALIPLPNPLRGEDGPWWVRLENSDMTYIQKYTRLTDVLRLESNEWRAWSRNLASQASQESLVEVRDRVSQLISVYEAFISEVPIIFAQLVSDNWITQTPSAEENGHQQSFSISAIERFRSFFVQVASTWRELIELNEVKTDIDPQAVDEYRDGASFFSAGLIQALASPDAALEKTVKRALIAEWDTVELRRHIDALDPDSDSGLSSEFDDAINDFLISLDHAQKGFREEAEEIWEQYTNKRESGKQTSAKAHTFSRYESIFSHLKQFSNNLALIHSVDEGLVAYLKAITTVCHNNISAESIDIVGSSSENTLLPRYQAAFESFNKIVLTDLKRIELSLYSEDPEAVCELSPTVLEAEPGEMTKYVFSLRNKLKEKWLLDVKLVFPFSIKQGDPDEPHADPEIVERSLGPDQTLTIPVWFDAPEVCKEETAEILITATGIDGTHYRQAENLTLRVKPTEKTDWPDYVPNPYILGTPIYADKSHMFFGREKVIEQIKGNFADSANIVVLQGNRRIGKTSILLQLEQEMAINKWIPICVNLQEVPASSVSPHGTDHRKGFDQANFYFWIARAIQKRILRVFGELAEDDQEKVPSPDTLAVLKSFDVKDIYRAEIPFQAFLDFVGLMAETISPYSVYLMLDEFDKVNESIENGKMAPDVLDNVRQLFQGSSSLSGLICGSLNLTRHRQDYWSVLYGIGKNIRLSHLLDEEANSLIAEPIRGAIGYSEQLLKVLRYNSANQPMVLQWLASFIYDEMCREGRRVVDVETVVKALDYVLDTYSDDFFAMLEQIRGLRIIRYLLFLISELEIETGERDFPRLQSDLYQDLGVEVELDQLEDWLKYLQDLDFVKHDPSNGTYRVQMPLFETWMIRTINRAQERDQVRVEWSRHEQSL